jgi:hypothetical protein
METSVDVGHGLNLIIIYYGSAYDGLACHGIGHLSVDGSAQNVEQRACARYRQQNSLKTFHTFLPVFNLTFGNTEAVVAKLAPRQQPDGKPLASPASQA